MPLLMAVACADPGGVHDSASYDLTVGSSVTVTSAGDAVEEHDRHEHQRHDHGCGAAEDQHHQRAADRERAPDVVDRQLDERRRAEDRRVERDPGQRGRNPRRQVGGDQSLGPDRVEREPAGVPRSVERPQVRVDPADDSARPSAGRPWKKRQASQLPARGTKLRSA